jgi:hypothetical protein
VVLIWLLIYINSNDVNNTLFLWITRKNRPQSNAWVTDKPSDKPCICAGQSLDKKNCAKKAAIFHNRRKLYSDGYPQGHIAPWDGTGAKSR